jgi:hypothetical protein
LLSLPQCRRRRHDLDGPLADAQAAVFGHLSRRIMVAGNSGRRGDRERTAQQREEIKAEFAG